MKNTHKKSSESKLTDMQSKSTDPTINTDPLGMWTGVPDDPREKPVQDADDL